MEGRALIGRRGLRGLRPRQVSREIRDEAVALEHQIREGKFQRWLSLIAGIASLLSGFEAAYEHYRAGYGLQMMYTPVLISPLLLIAGILGVFSRRAARVLLPIASLLTIADGLAGFYYHVRNIARRPGGWRLPVVNVVMGPPLMAPVLFGLSGYLGLIASLLRRPGAPSAPPPGAAWLHRLPGGAELESLEQEVREGRFQQQLAAVAAATAILSGIESASLHYKNAFRYRLEWTPILLAPLVGAAGLGTIRSRAIARTLLPLASVLAILDGTVGSFYHVRGIVRRPGGLRLGLYNLLYGPPPFAPLLLAASGFMGLLAGLLRRTKS